MISILSEPNAICINKIRIKLMKANPVLGTLGSVHRLTKIIEAHHVSAILQVFLDDGHDLVIRRECYTPLIAELWTLSILDALVYERPNSEPDIEFLYGQDMPRGWRPDTVDHTC